MNDRYFSQIDIFSSLIEGLSKLTPDLKMSIEKQNMLLKKAVEIADILNAADKPSSSPGEGIEAWLQSADTGRSSLYMASILAPEHFNEEQDYGHPHDPSDFARCMKLLEAEPSIKSQLHLMAVQSPYWAKLVLIWGEIEAMIETESPEWRQGNGSAYEAYKLITHCVSDQ